MNPLAGIYASVVAAKNMLYDRRWLQGHRLAGPVVSVGNLSVGGSGKTPFVILLGEMLTSNGIKFDVLSRGYGRRTRGVMLVEAGGNPAQFGDEPLLIARKLKVPVVVGEDRYAAGCFSEEKFGPQMHVLDDGFQHRGLARDFDIVLVTPDDVCGRMLPEGRMRESLQSLARADAIVLTNGVSADAFPVHGKILWRVQRGIEASAVPTRAVVFCGIARPQNFVEQLKSAGVCLVGETFYRDHHACTESDVDELLRLKQQSGADGFVTTEKDAVNLGKLIARLGPVAVIPVRMELEDAADALDTMLRTIKQRRQATVREFNRSRAPGR